MICQLQDEMINKVYLPLTTGNPIISNIFKNESLLPEGNIYGFVFNQLGVVVNDFITSTTNALAGNKGNINIVVHYISL